MAISYLKPHPSINIHLSLSSSICSCNYTQTDKHEVKHSFLIEKYDKAFSNCQFLNDPLLTERNFRLCVYVCVLCCDLRYFE